MLWLFVLSAAAAARAATIDNGLDSIVADDGAASIVVDNGVDSIVSDGPRLANCLASASFQACLKTNALLLLEDLTVSEDPIAIGPLTLVRGPPPEPGAGARPEPLLPADPAAREEALSGLVLRQVGRFVGSRALQLRLSDLLLAAPWNAVDEGRKKKGGGAGWAFVMAGGMMAALGLSGIAMLAGKALMVAMMALMLSTLAAMRGGGGGGGKGGGHSDHAATTYEVINVPTGHGHHGRSLAGLSAAPVGQPHADGAQIAYRAHAQSAVQAGVP